MTQPFWDSVYTGDEYRFGKEPNEFLASRVGEISPGGSVLCIGDGEGRNGVWLAGQGLRVTSLDQSPEAIRKTRALAAERGVAIGARVEGGEPGPVRVQVPERRFAGA